jgi:hypothetical protein
MSSNHSIENSIESPADKFERPSKAQAQIYGQIARGLTDVLMEYGFLSASGLPDPRFASFQEMFPPELMRNPEFGTQSKSLENS